MFVGPRLQNQKRSSRSHPRPDTEHALGHGHEKLMEATTPEGTFTPTKAIRYQQPQGVAAHPEAQDLKPGSRGSFAYRLCESRRSSSVMTRTRQRREMKRRKKSRMMERMKERKATMPLRERKVICSCAKVKGIINRYLPSEGLLDSIKSLRLLLGYAYCMAHNTLLLRPSSERSRG